MAAGAGGYKFGDMIANAINPNYANKEPNRIAQGIGSIGGLIGGYKGTKKIPGYQTAKQRRISGTEAKASANNFSWS